MNITQQTPKEYQNKFALIANAFRMARPYEDLAEQRRFIDFIKNRIDELDNCLTEHENKINEYDIIYSNIKRARIATCKDQMKAQAYLKDILERLNKLYI